MTTTTERIATMEADITNIKDTLHDQKDTLRDQKDDIKEVLAIIKELDCKFAGKWVEKIAIATTAGLLVALATIIIQVI